eukprot:3941288-Rhodomonas_salina.2
MTVLLQQTHTTPVPMQGREREKADFTQWERVGESPWLQSLKSRVCFSSPSLSKVVALAEAHGLVPSYHCIQSTTQPCYACLICNISTENNQEMTEHMKTHQVLIPPSIPPSGVVAQNYTKGEGDADGASVFEGALETLQCIVGVEASF